jgi:hypothetical protein
MTTATWITMGLILTLVWGGSHSPSGQRSGGNRGSGTPPLGVILRFPRPPPVWQASVDGEAVEESGAPGRDQVLLTAPVAGVYGVPRGVRTA